MASLLLWVLLPQQLSGARKWRKSIHLTSPASDRRTQAPENVFRGVLSEFGCPNKHLLLKMRKNTSSSCPLLKILSTMSGWGWVPPAFKDSDHSDFTAACDPALVDHLWFQLTQPLNESTREQVCTQVGGPRNSGKLVMWLQHCVLCAKEGISVILPKSANRRTCS